MKKYILYLLFSVLVCSCNHDEDDTLKFSSDSLQWIENGITFNSDEERGEIKFYYDGTTETTVDIVYDNTQDRHWLESTTYSDGNEHTIQIVCYLNNNTTDRTATVILNVGNKSFSFPVCQKGKGYAKPEITQYIFESEGGHCDIRIMSNGKVSAFISTDTKEWIESEITEKDGEYVLSLDAENNDGLGRVAFVNINVDGVPSGILSVRQKPCKLPESLTISTEGAGRLYVLLGDDQSNFTNVKNLTISGSINALDLYVLRKFVLTGYLGEVYPLNLDMFHAKVYKGYDCYYPELEIELTSPLPYVEDGVLPIGQFEYAVNLRSILLPGSLQIIEDRCFYGCSNLEQITIPDDVTGIGNNVFKSCPKLCEIELSPFSLLKSIGMQAFSTGCQIKSLYIPEGVDKILEYAFKFCSVEKLYVNWENPPVLDCVPKGDMLIVPNGSKSKYEATPKWNQYKYILEEE